MTSPQNYANHTRWHPPIHFFVLPVMFINFVWAIVDFVKAPGRDSVWWIVVSAALVMLTVCARTYALKVQDRVIRLEETLRYQKVLSSGLLEKTSTLRPRQIVALRFAPDEELESMVSAVVSGKLAKPAEIKQAIKTWRSDYFRV